MLAFYLMKKNQKEVYLILKFQVYANLNFLINKIFHYLLNNTALLLKLQFLLKLKNIFNKLSQDFHQVVNSLEIFNVCAKF